MSTRRFLRPLTLCCAALLVACADEHRAVPSLAPEFSSQGVSAASSASRFYQQRNLVSAGAAPADLLDTNLVNAWGLVSRPTTPWWLSDNGKGLSTAYTVAMGTLALGVSVPGAMGQPARVAGLVC